MPRPSYYVPDPLSLVTAPPKFETREERVSREAKEDHARRVSQVIDDALRAERLVLKKAKKQVKVLLLGQSHAGKSTTIKNLQMTYSYQAWQKERACWKAVVYLNLVRSVNSILDMLSEEMTSSRTTSHSQPPSPVTPTRRSDGDTELGCIRRAPSISKAMSDRADRSGVTLRFTGQHKVLKLRLGPLRRIQEDLEGQLGAASSEATNDWSSYSESTGGTSFIPVTPNIEPSGDVWCHRSVARLSGEFCVRSNSGWKGALKKLQPRSSLSESLNEPDAKEAMDGWMKRTDNAAEVIFGCKEDIKSLWADQIVQQLLRQRKLRLEDSSGFFLDDVDRVASRDYEPSDWDVVRARLRTTGVQEYIFQRETEYDWVFYDFCGARSSRSAWFPYFDNVHAIIFLAPIAPFDEYDQLPDGTSVNRLQDSFQMWKDICSSKLLSNVQLVLFMNKCDQLSKRLKHGNVMVRDHIHSFKNRTNEFKTVANYFRSYFREIQVQCSPTPREFFAHFTTAVDTQSTSLTLGAVQEAIVMHYLRDSDFI